MPLHRIEGLKRGLRGSTERWEWLGRARRALARKELEVLPRDLGGLQELGGPQRNLRGPRGGTASGRKQRKEEREKERKETGKARMREG